ncbi:aspartic peptidase domain-containing protein [Xylariaceae sp. FL1019]|nr:aspartic peptidase domain-containing protein [Xylariaceae sp. FL1019]
MTRYRRLLAAFLGTLLAPRYVQAGNTTALWLEPSLSWYGIDGNWSSTTLFVGEPAQQVDVLVSTSLSEVWVVGNGGCGSALCQEARGGVYNTSASSSWYSMGLWQLGLKYCGINANGDYGMETVVVYNSVKRWQTSLRKLVVASLNDTSVYDGFFGLGITAGNFNGTVAQGPITNLVENSGVVPSHSYGYTAGAYYAGARGVPMSLTLGGYDANRFEPHDVRFSLNSTILQPQTLVRAITASVSDVTKAPTAWSSSSELLSGFNESITAHIDSSTPYMWFPTTICDRFAEALNLTWNETLELYLFSGADNLQTYRAANLSFAFTLSSFDNKDDFGSPTDMPGVINITISGDAYIQSVRYPFMNLIEYGEPAIPYFPLKRTNSSNAILGRSFLQEAYIVTNYETNTFSVHQALFPDNPLRDTSIQTIAPSPESPYPGNPVPPKKQAGISQDQIAGVVVGICLGSIALVTTAVLIRRKRRQFKTVDHETVEYKDKDPGPTTEPNSPTSPIIMAMGRMKTIKMKAKPSQCKTRRKEAEPEAHEVGADWSHARFEMPATIPVELDATDATRGERAYFAMPARDGEQDQDCFERPKQWARLPQPVSPAHLPEPPDASLRAGALPPIDTRYRPLESTDPPSPTSSPTSVGHHSDRLPSPMTPNSDATIFPTDLSSPVAGFFPARTLSRSSSSVHSIMYAGPSPGSTNLMRSASATTSSSSHTLSTLSLQSSVQRTPIDSTHVVCLGPLPDNVRLPHQLMAQRQPGLHNPNFGLATIPSANPSRRQSAADTLGSNYTLEEEARGVDSGATNADSNNIAGRMDGFEIVHVPQMAYKRFSWEEGSYRDNSAR